MTSRCLACHRDIAALTAQNRGFHARAGKGDCAQCHPDHAGRDFALVKWPDGGKERFDHGSTGWPLDEKHARTSCEKCHTAERRVMPIAALAPKGATAQWTGLETTCASCHTDVHERSLGRDCQSCHTAAGWAPATRFDHARTNYPLTGKHGDVSCAKCHATPTRRAGDALTPVAQFKPLPHADCVSCHRDPHAARLRGSCANCHVTSSFTTVDDKAFSHDRTRYPLRGRHASVPCAACHVAYPNRVDRPAFGSCAACHSDPHAGKATLAGAAVDCVSCHNVAGFTPSTFTVAQHARTPYPLQGQHAMVACAACHTRRTRPTRAASDARTGGAGAASREVLMRPPSDRCESCHSDAHAGQLAARTDRGACVTCHSAAGWKPARFGVAEHAALRLPLTGRHAAIACSACHSPGRRGLPPIAASRALGTANVALTLSETTCDGCHRDPHGGKYAASAGAAQTTGTCAACHDTRAFHSSTIAPDAHARFAFALDGAHRATPCVACHTSMKNGASLGASLKLSAAPPATLTYTISGATASCASCHGTPHGDQFKPRADGGACQSCHDLRAWAPASRFDHRANGGFVLGPAHARVPCAGCHVPSAGTTVPTWRGVPRACEACHRGGVRRSP